MKISLFISFLGPVISELVSQLTIYCKFTIVSISVVKIKLGEIGQLSIKNAILGFPLPCSNHVVKQQAEWGLRVTFHRDMQV